MALTLCYIFGLQYSQGARTIAPMRRLYVLCLLALSLVTTACQPQETPSVIDSAGFATYQHPAGVFSLRLPATWVISDKSNEFALNVEFSPPNIGQSVVGVYVVSADALDASSTDIQGLYEAYLERREVDIDAWTEAAQPDDSIRFQYVLAEGEFNDFASVHNDYFVVMTTRIPKDIGLRRILSSVIDTLEVNTEADWFSVIRTGGGGPRGADAVGFSGVNFYESAQGDLIIMGQVSNDADLPMSFVRVRALLYGPEDRLITEQDTFLASDLLEPGEFAPFIIRLADGTPPNTLRFDLAASASYENLADTSFYGPDNFEVLADADFSDDEMLTIFGEVTNEGEETASLVKVIATVFDADGNVIGVANSLVEQQRLGSGETTRFELALFEIDGAPANFLISVQGITE